MESVINSSEVCSLPQIECANCVKTLPLRISRDLEQSSVWICAGCGMSFVGLAHAESLERQGRLVQLHDQCFDVNEVPDIPLHIRRHIASQVSRSSLPAHLEKRRSERVSNSMMIQAVAMDRDFVLHGNAMKVILNDISREGAGLAIPNTLTKDFLALKIPVTGGSAIQIIARVCRQRELSSPFLEVGCEFVTRLGN